MICQDQEQEERFFIWWPKEFGFRARCSMLFSGLRHVATRRSVVSHSVHDPIEQAGLLSMSSLLTRFRFEILSEVKQSDWWIPMARLISLSLVWMGVFHSVDTFFGVFAVLHELPAVKYCTKMQ